ncbi:hypothetical protein [Humisphaera borealis]|uniref:DUF4488 domain-containing protein n=1 Tax=Humisphaera borealis TaxID=2807512 RepID=A0A7M2X0Y7_9BACT|nr:hypothetical protein [Humisphaera borealis]QOV90781.1 hypothetical protein IPV69_05330 [Humisphaera borealis]
MLILTLVLTYLAPGVTLAEAPKTPAELVQGRWVRYQMTPSGRVKLVKEHTENKTVVTAYDKNETLIYAHASDFKVEQSGKVSVFTFTNRRIMAGPNAGQKLDGEVSFVCRVTEKQFVEVYGLLENDKEAPYLIVWERIQYDPLPR